MAPKRDDLPGRDDAPWPADDEGWDDGALRGGEPQPADGDIDDEPLRLVDQVLLSLPERDPARPLLYQLRRQLMDREITFQEARRALVELESALEKVTAPANRVGVFLGSPKDGIASVFVGGSEYYANIDPRVDPAQLTVGSRVLINEAYKTANPGNQELARWLDAQLETFDKIYSGRRPRYLEGYERLKKAITPWGR